MTIILGLGNPGTRYKDTRHNIGFRVIDLLADRLGIRFSEKKRTIQGRGDLEGTAVMLVKPMTYMNLSGQALLDIGRIDIDKSELIVVHDDIDMDCGRIKIKNGGGAGGHKGILSIIEGLGGQDFIRLKIGVGRDPVMPVEEYVLSKFRPDERDIIDTAVNNSANALGVIIKDGLADAMNRYNR